MATLVVHITLEAGAKAPPGRYTSDAGNGIVTDAATKRTWQRAVFPGTKTWEAAYAYCDALDLAGKQDWRLPDIRELESLIDTSTKDPAIDSEAFPGTPSGIHWSVSPNAALSATHWVVDFGMGRVLHEGKDSNQYFVRCVR